MIEIVYFSGTGSTQAAAEQLSAILDERSIANNLTHLNTKKPKNIADCETLVLLHPVYCMTAPKPISEFVDSLSNTAGITAAVISVSAGGEAIPNTACRMPIIDKLSQKGYNVIYEDMLVMPANCLKPTDEKVAAGLVKILPKKLRRIADNIVNKTVHRSTPDIISHIATTLGEKLKKPAALFVSKSFRVDDKCVSCASCIKKCPRENITLANNKPQWGYDCAMCLACIYACPQHAISLYDGKFALKGGYDFAAIVQAASTMKAEDIPEITLLHAKYGVKKYLRED